MSPKQIGLTAVVALLVVVAYNRYADAVPAGRRGMKIAS